MKKILFGLAALSAMAFGESTGVHNSTYGNNQIDVETRAFIINSGLVITASAGTVSTDGVNNPVIDAIKKAVLDHGTLMAGTTANSTVARTVYVRKTNGTNFPEGTVVNIALNADASNINNLKHTGGHTLAHTLTAAVTENHAKFKPGFGESTNGAQTLSLAGATGQSAGNFEVELTHNIEINLQSVIDSSEITAAKNEGEYINTSTLAVRFSKIPSTTADDKYKADYGTPGTVDSNSTGNQTAGIKADGTPVSATLAKR